MDSNISVIFKQGFFAPTMPPPPPPPQCLHSAAFLSAVLLHDAKELDLSLDGLPFLAFRVMNRDYQEKLARVNAWLRSTFDGDRVPAFQATEANVERLYALCSACEQVFVASICVSAQFFCNQCRFPVIVAHRPMQRDAELGIVTESALQMQQEYSAKASAITSELGFAGIDIESLPANVADNVNCLVSFAASLGCEDCNEATLCCALEELEQRRVNVEDSLAAERNRQQAIRDCTNDVSIRLQEVRRVVEGLASDTEIMESSAALNAPMTSQMEEKCRDYTHRLINLKSQLASVFWQTLLCSSLCQRVECLPFAGRSPT
jgi:hypothetical protein